MSSIRVAAVIPARMGSSRFPGKPLLPFHGLPMVEHVRRRALLSGVFTDVVVATCDKEIQHAIEGFGGRVLMTSPDHPGATDRVAEAANHLNCTHVVNVQGDEILILPADLKAMVDSMRKNPDGPSWNAIAPILRKEELSDTSVVKCVVSKSNRVLSCSRLYPHLPDGAVRIVLGILGYEKNFLYKVGKMDRTPLELAESIDQNRIIENDVAMQGVPFTKGYPGINEPREVELVENYMKSDRLQQDVLEKILSKAGTFA